MAVALVGDELQISGTATSLTTLLGLTSAIYFTTLALYANHGNGGNIYGGKSDVTTVANRMIYLRPNTAFTIDINVGYCSTDQWYFIAEVPGDTLHVAGVS